MHRAFEAWVILALGLYYAGPIPWPHRDDPRVAIVVLACLAGFRAGTRLGDRLPSLRPVRMPLLAHRPVLYAIAAVFLALSTYHASLLTGRSLLSTDLFSADPGEAYALFQQQLRTRAEARADLGETLVLMLKAAVFPLVFLGLITAYSRDRMATLALAGPFIATGFLRGTDKESVDLAIVFLVLMHAHGQLRRRAVAVVGFVALVLLLFATRKIARFGGDWLACVPAMPEACIDPNSWTAAVLPPGIDFLRLVGLNYLTNGFEGMAIALDLPHRFTWGLGQFEPLRAKLCTLSGLGCGFETFEMRLPDAGWDTRFRWHSAFAEIANDTHWLFLPLWFAAFGVVFAVSLASWRASRDPLSLLFIVIAALVFAYLPANFQMAASVEWTVLFLFATCVQGWRILTNPRQPRPRTMPCS